VLEISFENQGFAAEIGVSSQKLAMRNPCFTLIPTVTRLISTAWPYEKGPIDRVLLTRYLQGLHGPVYYVSGPSGMVVAMTKLLRFAGVSDDDVKTEEFGDYKLNENPVQTNCV
jgi:ferredoxin-NADP reductase